MKVTQLPNGRYAVTHYGVVVDQFERESRAEKYVSESSDSIFNIDKSIIPNIFLGGTS